ncbi:hypothetical protein M2301_002533 [Micromonospora sp. 1209]|nr:hypothetical protein [Bacillus aerius]MDH8711135.1 hypothetical protein [Micromonospora sp. 1209]
MNKIKLNVLTKEFNKDIGKDTTNKVIKISLGGL